MAKLKQLVKSPGVHHVVTLNPEMLVLSDQDPNLKTMMQQADLCIPDGSGIIRGIRAHTGETLTRLTGVDMLSHTMKLEGFSHYFIGATPTVSQRLKDVLTSQFTHQMHFQHGYFSDDEQESVIGGIQKVRPDFIWVGMGFPKQEIFIGHLLSRLDHGVAVGVGGSFDVLSGSKKRAPKWIQASGFEWLYRLIQEPKRLKRYGFLCAYFWRYRFFKYLN